jgi:hypothetical protein
MPRTPNQEAYYLRLRKLSPAQIEEIKQAYNVPLSIRPTLRGLAHKYKVSVNAIWRAINTSEVIP